MGTQKWFESVLDDIYSSIVGPESWPSIMASLADAVGATAGQFFTPNFPVNSGGFWYQHNIDETGIGPYINYYESIDIWKKNSIDLGCRLANTCVRSEELIGDDELHRTEFYNDFLSTLGIGRFCGVMLADPMHPGSPDAFLTLYRPAAAQPFPDSAIELLGRLTPHLRRALSLRSQLLIQEQRLPLWAESLLDQITLGVIVIDHTLRVLHTNQEAWRLLTAGDGLSISRERTLALARSGDTSLLQAKLLRAVSPGHSAVSADVAVIRPSGAAPYLLTVVPLPGDAVPVLGVSGARAVVYVADPARRPADLDERLRALFGLTAAERRVAAGLLANHTIADIAERNGLSVETVRSQVKSLLARTGTSRQGELLNLLHKALVLPWQEGRR